MKVGIGSLRGLLFDNVAEIKFRRRNPKPGAPATRRMLCTNCDEILKSPEGRQALGYQATSQPPKYNPTAKNLLIAWDLLKQDYRAISCDEVHVISVVPKTEFWEYYNNKLYKMTTEQKQSFFDV